MGAVVQPNAPERLVREAAVVIVVKKVAPGYEKVLKHAKRVVWDVVDAWPQPAGNRWPAAEAIKFIKARAKQLGADQIVCATRCMQDDLRGDFTLYHHHWPGAEPIKIRHTVKNVVYEGSPKYLERWMKPILAQCEARGWNFLINAPLSSADIVLALRGGEWAGYAPHHWKSNVKLANAQGYGIPCVLNSERGYVETASGGECWADCEEHLHRRFDWLSDYQNRFNAQQLLKASAYSVEQAAADYLEWLDV